MIVQSPGEQVRVICKALYQPRQPKSAKSSTLTQIVARLPDRLHGFLLRTPALVAPVESREENRIVAHFREKRRLFARVPEGIDLPSDSRPRTFTESVLQELQSVRKLVHNALIVSGRFVVHRPGAADKLETTFVDQLLHLFLQGFGLLVIPPREERRLDVHKFSGRVLQKPLDDSVDDARNICLLDSIFALRLTGLIRFGFSKYLFFVHLLP